MKRLVIAVVSAIVALLGWVGPARATTIPLCTAPCTASVVPLLTDIGPGPTSASNFGSSAHADFGDLGITAFDTLGPVEAQWIDSFTVVGSTGTGTMTIDWSLDGTLFLPTFGSPCTFVTAHASLSELGAFGSAIVASDFIDRCTVPPPTTTVPVNLTGSINVPFIYGVAVTGGFDLSGGASLGTADFPGSARVTNVVLPAGATLLTASGTVYPGTVAAPVPEPASLVLLGTGLGATLSRLRRRRSTPHTPQ